MIFYVYEHWRPDLDVCFYVGKGHGSRARNLSRNAHHRNVRTKLATLGMCVEVRLVASGLAEHAAFALEKQRIAFWRERGVHLANRTNGGEGPAGLVFSDEARARLRAKRKNRIFTESDRAAMSAGRLGMKFSDRHRASLAARKAGVPRRPFTDATRERMRAAAARREAAKREKYGSEVRRTSRIREPA